MNESVVDHTHDARYIETPVLSSADADLWRTTWMENARERGWARERIKGGDRGDAERRTSSGKGISSSSG